MMKWLAKTMLFALMALLAFVGLRLFAVQQDQPRVHIAKSGVLSLGELSHLVRTQTGREFYIDKRHQQRRIFITEGSYGFDEIVKALKVGSAMVCASRKRSGS